MELDGLPSTVMTPPAVTLTFDLLTRKPNQYVCGLRYIGDLILVKLAPIVTKILYSSGFPDHCLLWPSRLTFSRQNLISTAMNRNTSVTKIG